MPALSCMLQFGMRVLMGGRHKPSNKQLKMAAVEAGEDPDHVTNGTGHAEVEAKTAPATGVEHGSKRNKTVRPCLCCPHDRPDRLTRRSWQLNEGGKLEDANADDARKAKEERDQMVGIVAKGLQDALNDMADLWEMMAKWVAPLSLVGPRLLLADRLASLSL
jgi:hypothetical protein